MKVHWTDRATSRLKLTHDYIAQNSPLVAKKVVERIVIRSRQIGGFPQSGRAVPEYRRDDPREVLERPYRIIYRVLPNRIDVITLMHYRQLLPSDFEKLD
jgi:toxin ParE1/3/4